MKRSLILWITFDFLVRGALSLSPSPPNKKRLLSPPQTHSSLRASRDDDAGGVESSSSLRWISKDKVDMKRRIIMSSTMGATFSMTGVFDLRESYATPDVTKSTIKSAAKSAATSTSSSSSDNTAVTSLTSLSQERYLLQLLPVKSVVFRTLRDYVYSLNSLRTASTDITGTNKDPLKVVKKNLEQAIEFLDRKRRSLEPVFNENDSAMFQILKAERGEQLIEKFRTELVVLLAYAIVRKQKELLARQDSALLALADIGELLVDTFPYNIPKEGKFSYLPRLEGRCKVTFTFARGNEMLGNVTILADGFAAPITAGNFVDLSNRGFYTGLPVKTIRKKFGGTLNNKANTPFLSLESLGIDPEREESDPNSPSTVVSQPILGSYREGFYDPLTAKPRRIPLEVLKQDVATSGSYQLSYDKTFAELPDEFLDVEKTMKPVLNFETPGLVALNHNDRTLGSSEFFVLPDMPPEKARLLNGQYAPFGYIIEGSDIAHNLKAGDVIQATYTSTFGLENLMKIRGSSFSDVMQQDE